MHELRSEGTKRALSASILNGNGLPPATRAAGIELTPTGKGVNKEMRIRGIAMLAAFVVVGLCASASAGLKEGVKLEADGEAIDVQVGHLVPLAMDWNDDGKKDLIVGQFSGGKIRLYLNHGTDSAPVFKDFEYLRAGDAEISLPAG